MTADDRNAMTNPMTFDEYNTYYSEKGLQEDGKDPVAVQWDTPVESWNNKTLREIGVDASEPVKTVFYNNSENGFVYFYLNFTDSQKASDFCSIFTRALQKKKWMSIWHSILAVMVLELILWILRHICVMLLMVMYFLMTAVSRAEIWKWQPVQEARMQKYCKNK